MICENQRSYVVVIYWSPSKSHNEYKDFFFNLEKGINQIKQLKSSLTIILDDFNARSNDWWPDDITSPEGSHINSLITLYGLDQLISDATHDQLMSDATHTHKTLVWDCKRANASAINAALNQVDQRFLFFNKSINPSCP